MYCPFKGRNVALSRMRQIEILFNQDVCGIVIWDFKMQIEIDKKNNPKYL